jgi:uroporphyrinogen III methyltransferase/synthase
MVSLVGAGPGDPGLLSLRARQRLLSADVVVYDRLAAGALPCDLPQATQLHCVGKQAQHHPVTQEEIIALLLRLAREGKRVVRLKGGDPFVFGRGGEEAEALAEAGISFEIVPGVTAAIAVPAYAGIPITYRKEVVRVTLVTAHEAIKSRGQVDWDLLAKDAHATLVGYMGVNSLPAVVGNLLKAGMDPHTPAAMIEQGTTASQRTVFSTVERLPEKAKEEGIEPPALFVIGPVVRHAQKLAWFTRRPLFGQRLIMTAPGGELGRQLDSLGAQVVEVPLPITEVARVVMGAWPLSGCVFRSPDEADALEEERDALTWSDRPTAICLGERTAYRARQLNWKVVKQFPEGPVVNWMELIS